MEPRIKLLKPSVNISTISDGRGGIFTYFPERGDIKEWSYIVTNKGSNRGHHHHPEFDEYIMMVQGHGCYIEKSNDQEHLHLVGPGDCIFIPADVSHTFEPMEDCRMLALLTKRWDKCQEPIKRDK